MWVLTDIKKVFLVPWSTVYFPNYHHRFFVGFKNLFAKNKPRSLIDVERCGVFCNLFISLFMIIPAPTKKTEIIVQHLWPLSPRRSNILNFEIRGINFLHIPFYFQFLDLYCHCRLQTSSEVRHVIQHCVLIPLFWNI